MLIIPLTPTQPSPKERGLKNALIISSVPPSPRGRRGRGMRDTPLIIKTFIKFKTAPLNNPQ